MLGLVLRQNAGNGGVKLDDNGWADVSVLIKQMQSQGFDITIDMLTSIVESSDKRQFSFNDNATKIRASMPNMAKIEPLHVSQKPPRLLYFPVGLQFVKGILTDGLLKKNKNQVQLLADKQAAEATILKKGRTVVLAIKASEMHRNGIGFYKSDNNSWLISSDITAEYIDLA